MPADVILDHLYIHDIALRCADLPTTVRIACMEPSTNEHLDCSSGSESST